jgi:DNA-binding NtrC family response regulator
MADALHRLGPRRSRKLVTVNCSAFVETLFESELFGHVRGAFTGATTDKIGVFEAADSGTVFLDEVGECPAGARAKLLRTLENGERYASEASSCAKWTCASTPPRTGGSSGRWPPDAVAPISSTA